MSAADRPGAERRAPTLRDVARVSGVSYQTVSRYLNRPDTVAARTAERVSHAIDELGYVPNEAARALRLGGGLRAAASS
ncbi:MAG: LacI family DNA-binding transcriptional regulator [Amnibacterium sp.]